MELAVQIGAHTEKKKKKSLIKPQAENRIKIVCSVSLILKLEPLSTIDPRLHCQV